MVHIVESNAQPPPGAAARTVHAYSSAATVELLVNGASLGERSNAEWMGWNEWNMTSWTAGNMTAVARSAAGAVVATHTRITAGAAAAIKLTIDAPSPSTGTGEKLLLDGHDVALVRATVVDPSGHPVETAAHNISFDVVSGAGRILGVGNGDPKCHEPHQVSWRSAYNGLARAVVKATEDRASPAATRALIREIDLDTGRSTVRVADPASPDAPIPITVTASAPGLASGRVAIEVSADGAADGVLGVARRSIQLPISLD